MTDRQRRYASYSRSVEGSTVRKYNNDFDVVRELQREPKKQVDKQTRRNREKARFMNSSFDFLATFILVPVILGYALPKLTEKQIKDKYKNQTTNVENNNKLKTAA